MQSLEGSVGAGNTYAPYLRGKADIEDHLMEESA